MKTIQKTKPELEEFYGLYINQMPELIKSGFKPATIPQIMQARLNENLSFDEYYDSASGIAYFGSKIKIIPYSQELVNVNPQTELHNGGIKLTNKEYEAINEKEFSRKDMILNQRLTPKQVLQHQGWLELAQDKKLLEKYTEEVFKRVKDRYDEDTAMAFHIRDNQNVPNLRAVRAVFLDWLDGRSDDASDRDDLDGNARLVGIRESAKGTEPKIKVYTPEQISEVLSELRVSGLEQSILKELEKQR